MMTAEAMLLKRQILRFTTVALFYLLKKSNTFALFPKQTNWWIKTFSQFYEFLLKVNYKLINLIPFESLKENMNLL